MHWSHSEIDLLKEIYPKFGIKHTFSVFKNRSYGSIEGKIKRLKLKVLHRNNCLKYSFNKDFFSQMTDKSIYWAGFLAADGCIARSNKNEWISLIANVKDIGHINLFKQDIEYTR